MRPDSRRSVLRPQRPGWATRAKSPSPSNSCWIRRCSAHLSARLPSPPHLPPRPPCRLPRRPQLPRPPLAQPLPRPVPRPLLHPPPLHPQERLLLPGPALAARRPSAEPLPGRRRLSGVLLPLPPQQRATNHETHAFPRAVDTCRHPAAGPPAPGLDRLVRRPAPHGCTGTAGCAGTPPCPPAGTPKPRSLKSQPPSRVPAKRVRNIYTLQTRTRA